MQNERCELRFKSDPIRVRKMVRIILDFIDKKVPGLPAEEQSDLKLVFNELLFNAVLHGNAHDSGKYVHISMEISGNCVSACITDEGPGYDYHKVLDLASGDAGQFSENGRGILLVCALTDDITFSKNGSQVRFVKHLKGDVRG